jgi:hypothetical protein
VLLKPSPTPLEEPIRSERSVAQHRRLGCPLYAGCLNQSVELGWESFSCAQCPLAARGDDVKVDVTSYAQQRTHD